MTTSETIDHLIGLAKEKKAIVDTLLNKASSLQDQANACLESAARQQEESWALLHRAEALLKESTQ